MALNGENKLPNAYKTAHHLMSLSKKVISKAFYNLKQQSLGTAVEKEGSNCSMTRFQVSNTSSWKCGHALRVGGDNTSVL